MRRRAGSDQTATWSPWLCKIILYDQLSLNSRFAGQDVVIDSLYQAGQGRACLEEVRSGAKSLSGGPCEETSRHAAAKVPRSPTLPPHRSASSSRYWPALFVSCLAIIHLPPILITSITVVGHPSQPRTKDFFRSIRRQSQLDSQAQRCLRPPRSSTLSRLAVLGVPERTLLPELRRGQRCFLALPRRQGPISNQALPLPLLLREDLAKLAHRVAARDSTLFSCQTMKPPAPRAALACQRSKSSLPNKAPVPREPRLLPPPSRLEATRAMSAPTKLLLHQRIAQGASLSLFLLFTRHKRLTVPVAMVKQGDHAVQCSAPARRQFLLSDLKAALQAARGMLFPLPHRQLSGLSPPPASLLAGPALLRLRVSIPAKVTPTMSCFVPSSSVKV